MIDGKSFYVKTDESNLVKFTESILPKGGNDTISIFQCQDSELYGLKLKYNSVVIVGSKVSSVEFYVNK